jgi:hypothetical protein
MSYGSIGIPLWLFCLSMIPRVKPEGMLFGKPDFTLESSPRAGFFRIML